MGAVYSQLSITERRKIERWKHAKVVTLVERKMRYAVLFRVQDRSTTHLMNRLMDVMESLPQPARRFHNLRPRDRVPELAQTSAWDWNGGAVLQSPRRLN